MSARTDTRHRQHVSVLLSSLQIQTTKIFICFISYVQYVEILQSLWHDYIHSIRCNILQCSHNLQSYCCAKEKEETTSSNLIQYIHKDSDMLHYLFTFTRNVYSWNVHQCSLLENSLTLKETYLDLYFYRITYLECSSAAHICFWSIKTLLGKAFKVVSLKYLPLLTSRLSI